MKQTKQPNQQTKEEMKQIEKKVKIILNDMIYDGLMDSKAFVWESKFKETVEKLVKLNQDTREEALEAVESMKTEKTRGGFPDCGEHNGIAECCRNKTIDDILQSLTKTK